MGEKNGFEEFYIYSLGNSSFYKHKEVEPVSVLRVQTSRFDNLNISNPDLVVIDCQSGEYKVIAGFGKELQKVKWICFETGFYSGFQTNQNFDAVNRVLKKAGFRLVATNVSGKGIIRFWVMRFRGIIHNIRLIGFRGIKSYSGFFDVLYINTKIVNEG